MLQVILDLTSTKFSVQAEESRGTVHEGAQQDDHTEDLVTRKLSSPKCTTFLALQVINCLCKRPCSVGLSIMKQVFLFSKHVWNTIESGMTAVQSCYASKPSEAFRGDSLLSS